MELNDVVRFRSLKSWDERLLQIENSDNFDDDGKVQVPDEINKDK